MEGAKALVSLVYFTVRTLFRNDSAELMAWLYCSGYCCELEIELGWKLDLSYTCYF